MPEEQRTTLPGAGHGAEIQFVFGTLGTFYASKTGYTAMDRKVSADMGHYWTNFAKTGNPNGEGLVAWPADKAGRGFIDRQKWRARRGRFPQSLGLDLMAARAAP